MPPPIFGLQFHNAAMETKATDYSGALKIKSLLCPCAPNPSGRSAALPCSVSDSFRNLSDRSNAHLFS